ncbi:uncharacterized protein BXZ73DRAFT_97089 [Epithele typhae]|uniref:uncharacterized protein n=1 Tax=Epithele typhae TaxID=378194 RepID=UPI002008856E|nr:uncharacterized protein BXZ73DRAFT_97089 [Epithele typhae]KAH9943025.1 hypothetical protein BXZ73DRAFT_97089 [Epithele typhae]
MSDLDATLGALFLGVFVSTILWGISCSQLYYYYNGYPNDRAYTKVMVLAVWASDTAHQALVTHTLYTYLITEYGNPTALSYITKTIVVEVLFNGITGFLVQTFFVVRVWKLSDKNNCFAAPLGLLVLAELVFSIGYFSEALSLSTYTELPRVRALSISMNVFAAAADVSIAGSLCFMLNRSRSEFVKSNTLINKLILFAVNTGLLTSVCACISLITYFTLPLSFVYICFYFLMGRLYANSLLATLNARNRLRSHAATDGSLSLPDMQPSANLARISRHGEGIAIRIETTNESDIAQDADTSFDGASQKGTAEV